VTAHISRARHLKIAIEAGVDDVAHMIVDPLPDDLVTRMIDQDMYWEPTLELWDGVHRQYGADWNAVAIDNLGHFAAAGGKVVLGTDFGTGYIFDFELGMPMTEIALMQKAGMTPMQIIMAATKHAAQVCNLGAQLGTLEPGKIADIIVVAGDPLDDMAAMRIVRIVAHNGILIRNDIE
jgi:imidazolonepropionase-like amidohydrolase